MFGPVLDQDEHGLLEADLSLSWLYGGDGQYRRSDYFVLARPAVMVGALAVNAAINHRRKAAARRDSQPRWRDEQTVHTWTTTHRLIWEGPTGLEQLWYGDVTGFYPDLSRWTLTLDTGGSALLCGSLVLPFRWCRCGPPPPFSARAGHRIRAWRRCWTADLGFLHSTCPHRKPTRVVFGRCA